MSIEISRETEARLIEEARRQGISVEALLKRLMSEAATAHVAGTAPELPVWHLGGMRPDEMRRSGKGKAQAFVAWAKGHRPTKLLSDDAVQRSSFYPDRP